MVRTPAQARPLSAKRVHLSGCSYHVPGMDAERAHLNGCYYPVPGMDTVLTRTRSALRTCLRNGEHTCSPAPAQQRTHACHCTWRSAPALRGQCAGGVCPDGGVCRGSVLESMVSTPAHVHLLSTAHMLAKWEARPLTSARSALHTCLPSGQHTRSCQIANTPAQLHPLALLPNDKHARSRAPAQHCIHACQMVSTPAHLHPLSTAPTPAKW